MKTRIKECDMCGYVTRGNRVGDKCPECMQGTLWRIDEKDDGVGE